MRPVLAHALVIFVLITSLGAARPNNSDPQPSAKAAATKPKRRSSHHRPRHHRKAYQIGRASWYGKYFHGKKTASGEPYNMFEFTAAHPQLPLGTLVRVTNLRNERTVVVRINDRGPIPKDRIIDLSYGAAQILGLRAEGVERVRLDLVKPDTVARVNPDIAGLP